MSVYHGGDRPVMRSLPRRLVASLVAAIVATGSAVALAELTLVRIKINPDSQPDYVVVRLDDPLLFRCPMLYLEDAGTARFSDDEVKGLRNYLLKGGFVTVDDFWGTAAWEQWVDEISR